MKKSLLVLTTLLVSMTLTAGNVTEQEALRKAQQFMQGRSFQQKNLRRAATANTFAQDAFYVFNADGNQGFVIVSADDRTEAILGYADTGSIDLNRLPANAAAWLQDYARQIKSLGEGVNLAAPHRAPGTEKVLMETAKWDQEAPYNGMCPEDDKGKCYTGCTTTAVAIVLRYFKWPEKMEALEGYTSAGKQLPALLETQFNWGNLKITYTNTDGKKNYTDADSAEVAKIMRYCGQAIKTQFGSSSSSGSVHVKDMIETFGYSITAKEAMRNGFSTEEWEKMVYDEIVAQRVVYYSGYHEGVGHSFVIDGYDGNGLFHVNWGWGGRDDGYFTLATLNPGDKSISGIPADNGYPITQTAIFMKKPETGDVASKPYFYNSTWVPDEEGYKKEYTRGSTSENFADVQISTKFDFTGVEAPVIQYMLWAYYTVDGHTYEKELIPNPDWKLWEIDLKSDKSSRTCDPDFGANWDDGTYEIRTLYRIKGQEEWQFPRVCENGSKVYATIKGTKLTLSNSFPYGDISVKFDGDYVVNRPMAAIVTWTRPQDNENNENKFFLWLKGMDKPVGGVSGYADKGKKETLTIAFKAPTAGEFEYYITSDEEGEMTVFKSTDKIKIKDIGQQVLDIKWTADESKCKKVKESEYELNVSEFHPKVAVQNNGDNVYDDNIVCQLIPIDAQGKEGKPMIQSLKVDNLAAKAKSEVEAVFKGLTNKQRYEFRVYHYTNEVMEEYGRVYYAYRVQDYITVKDATGINAVKAGEKGDAPIYNLNGQRISSPKKGIFIKNGKKYVVK